MCVIRRMRGVSLLRFGRLGSIIDGPDWFREGEKGYQAWKVNFDDPIDTEGTKKGWVVNYLLLPVKTNITAGNERAPVINTGPQPLSEEAKVLIRKLYSVTGRNITAIFGTSLSDAVVVSRHITQSVIERVSIREVLGNLNAIVRSWLPGRNLTVSFDPIRYKILSYTARTPLVECAVCKPSRIATLGATITLDFLPYPGEEFPVVQDGGYLLYIRNFGKGPELAVRVTATDGTLVERSVAYSFVRRLPVQVAAHFLESLTPLQVVFEINNLLRESYPITKRPDTSLPVRVGDDGTNVFPGIISGVVTKSSAIFPLYEYHPAQEPAPMVRLRSTGEFSIQFKLTFDWDWAMAVQTRPIMLLNGTTMSLIIRPGTLARYAFVLRLCDAGGCGTISLVERPVNIGGTYTLLITVNSNFGYRTATMFEVDNFRDNVQEIGSVIIRRGVLAAQPIFWWHTGLPHDHSRMISRLMFWREYCPSGRCVSTPILHVFEKIGALGDFSATMDIRLSRKPRVGEEITLVESEEMRFFLRNRGNGLELAVKHLGGADGWRFVSLAIDRPYTIMFVGQVGYRGWIWFYVHNHPPWDVLVDDYGWPLTTFTFSTVPTFTLGDPTSRFRLWDTSCAFYDGDFHACELYDGSPIVELTR